MSEQKETKNVKNAAEAQAPEQNTTETAAKQADDAKQADTTEQQVDAAAFQVVNEGFSPARPLRRLNAASTARFRSARRDARLVTTFLISYTNSLWVTWVRR